MINLEMFNSISGFISTVIIGGIAVFVTYIYNSNQLKISTNEDLSKIIPKLGSADANTRKWGAISLSLYGKDAVSPLIAMLDDEEENVATAASTALKIIGKPAIHELKEIIKNKKNSTNKRGWAVYTLGLMRAKEYNLIISELESNEQNLPENAAIALGLLKERRSAGKLREVLKKSVRRNPILTKNIVWALGEIQEAIPNDLMDGVIYDLIGLLKDENKDIQKETEWLLRDMGNRRKEKVLESLSKVKSNDKETEKVRKAAEEAIDLINPKGSVKSAVVNIIKLS